MLARCALDRHLTDVADAESALQEAALRRLQVIMAIPHAFTPGVLETDDRVEALAFDATERFLVADDKVFEAGRAEPTPLDVELGTLVPHPSKPLVAVVQEHRVSFVELEGKRHVTHVEVKEANEGAFDAKGTSFVVSSYSTQELKVFSLEGKLQKTLAMPGEDQTAAAVAFGPDDATILAFTDDQQLVVLPLDGAPATTYALPKVKVLSGHARYVGGDRVLFYDTANAAMVTSQGKVLWTSAAEKDATALVPGKDALACVRLNKKALAFWSLKTGKEIAALKIKVKAAPLGLACTRTLVAWARDGAIELLALPPLG